MSETARVLDSGESCPRLPLVEGEGDARAVAWPGVGSKLRSMTLIELAGGGSTIPLRHEMEAVYYIISGTGSVNDPDLGESQAIIEGSVVHVDPGTAYQFVSDAAGLKLIGGPCPPDPALYQHLTTASAG